MGRGRKVNVPVINPIMPVMCSGAAHEVKRASYELVEKSCALKQVSPARAAEHRGALNTRQGRACASSRRTSGHTRRKAGK